MILSNLLGRRVEVLPKDELVNEDCSDKNDHLVSGSIASIQAMYLDKTNNLYLLLALEDSGRLYPMYCNNVKLLEG